MVLLAKDIMDRSILTVPVGTDALTCARKMAEARKGYAVVTRDGPTTIAGIVTEWDFLEKVVVKGMDAAKTPINSIATPVVHTCSPDTPTDEVASKMASLGVRRIVVRSGDQVVGIITSRGVLSAFRQYVDKLTAEIAGYQAQGTPLG